MDQKEFSMKSTIIKENGMSSIKRTSPDASSTTSGTPTPPSGSLEKNWVARYENIGVCEEQRQLLGTEEESSDKHSSDGEGDVGDVWALTDEQHEYYETQFKLLQPDLTASISGNEARAYFEKSKLPVEDLRKIWQLSDITKDGALSLMEFKIAMHLVVLKRNNIQLPDILPQSLVQTLPVSCRSPSLSNSESLSSPQLKGKEWTKFVDSPTSSLSSPGLKPVNFDFLRPCIERNPKILHPVAVRATPSLDNTDDVNGDSKKIPVSDSMPISEGVPIKAIQRPQPKKHAVPGPGAIPPPPPSNSDDAISISGPTSLPVINSRKDPPPPPPPRPTRTHFRSSSLDLNKLGKVINPVPHIPTYTSLKPNSPITASGEPEHDSHFADFSQYSYHGAFHVYKRADTKQNTDVTQEKKVIVPDICIDEKNRYLRHVCLELQEELNALREERVALQFKLEKLHLRSPIRTITSNISLA